jgi:DNA-binding MarR family transcriptional regulator
MDPKLALVADFLKQVDRYLAPGTNPPELEKFAAWLLQSQTDQPSGSLGVDAGQTMRQVGTGRSNLSFFLVRMRKFAGHYLKHVFQDTPFSGVDDFSFLGTLLYEGAMTKTDLIRANVTDIPTGMDVIKRLIKNGLVEVERSKEDRRSVVVKATMEGRMTFFGILPALEKAGRVVEANLSTGEKEVLVGLLDKLDAFHTKIFKEETDLDPEALIYAGRV